MFSSSANSNLVNVPGVKTPRCTNGLWHAMKILLSWFHLCDNFQHHTQHFPYKRSEKVDPFKCWPLPRITVRHMKDKVINNSSLAQPSSQNGQAALCYAYYTDCQASGYFSNILSEEK